MNNTQIQSPPHSRRRRLSAGIGLAVLLLAGATGARAAVTDISGALADTLDNVIGAGNSGRLVGDTMTAWPGGVFYSDVDLNGHTLDCYTGNGNGQWYCGVITGPGTIAIQGRTDASWAPDVQFQGAVANTPTSVVLHYGRCTLYKTPGVDALAGAITVDYIYDGMTAQIQLYANDQINDAATIDTSSSPSGSGNFILGLDDILNLNGGNGFSDRIASLSIKTGDVVITGVGGILYVNELYLDGVQQPHVAKANDGDGFVLGSGYIDVGNSGPPVPTEPPTTPATPTPADLATDVNPAYLTKLDWADCTRATSYDVYFWAAGDTKPVTPTATVSISEYTLPAQVLCLTNYKWQVVAQNAIGPTLGPEWSFSTVDRTLITGDLQNTLDAVVLAGPATLMADASTFWYPGTFYADVYLNGHTFTINTGNGNPQDYEGTITGPGTLGIVGNGNAFYGNDPVLGGTTANTMSAVNMVCGHLVLNKTPGVDALTGPITVNAPRGGYVAVIEVAANDQINDASTIDSTPSSTDAPNPGTFHLQVDAGVTETISGLAINTGHTVNTGDGSVLTVTNLSVGGVLQAPGTYTAGNCAFVTGTGSVVVQAAPPPAAPASPTPVDGATGVDPGIVTKLDWADSVGAGLYDVYLWIPAVHSKPLTPTATVSPSEYSVPGGLRPGSTYKWQVVAKNASGTSPGPEWTFTTLETRTFTDLSGTLADGLDAVVGAGNTGRLIADATTVWYGGVFYSDVDLNGHTLDCYTGNGNGQWYCGVITGPGTIAIQGRTDASWAPDVQFQGAVANTPTSVVLHYGRCTLYKTPGVDALAGAITVDYIYDGMTAQIQLYANDQINDAATIDTSSSPSGSGNFILGLDDILNLNGGNGFSDRFASLSIKTGDVVNTGVGGVLTVTHLTVNGSAVPAGTYAGGSQDWVLGSGSVVVLSGAAPRPPDFPPSCMSLPGGVPTFAIPSTDSSKTYTLEYRDDLGSGTWTALTGSGTGTGNGGTLTLSDPTTPLPAQRFYRLGVQ